MHVELSIFFALAEVLFREVRENFLEIGSRYVLVKFDEFHSYCGEVVEVERPLFADDDVVRTHEEIFDSAEPQDKISDVADQIIAEFPIQVFTLVLQHLPQTLAWDVLLRKEEQFVEIFGAILSQLILPIWVLQIAPILAHHLCLLDGNTQEGSFSETPAHFEIGEYVVAYVMEHVEGSLVVDGEDEFGEVGLLVVAVVGVVNGVSFG